MIRVSSDGAVGRITLDAPERLNAMQRADYDTLIEALDRVEADEALRVVVLAAEGRVFCAGTDLSQGFDLPSGGDPASGAGVPPDLGGRVTLRLRAMRKPVLVAVQGAAVGFGASLCLPCDFRIAAPAARFCWPFARRGIANDGCSSWFLPQLVGPTRAADWLLTGRFVATDEALAAGLLTRIAEDPLAEALALARDLAEGCSPLSLALNRELLWRGAGARGPEALHDLESRAMVATLAGPDPAEGARAFAEKRAPRFSSRAADAGFVADWPEV